VFDLESRIDLEYQRNHYAMNVVPALERQIHYWREAVKNANEHYGRGMHDTPTCNFCNEETHLPDCPWLHAQSESATVSPNETPAGPQT
jgi:hypothetical protein